MARDGCAYCSGEKHLINTRTQRSKKGDFYPGIEVTVEDSCIFIGALADTYEPCWREADREINYCPICGRKFKR